jgi:cysteine desulfurase
MNLGEYKIVNERIKENNAEVNRRIYLDYNASTPIDPTVQEAMLPYLSEHYGNPSTTHWAGRPAKEAVEKARKQVANLLQCNEEEIVFTSGGSESNNHAIQGVYFVLKEKGNHIITTNIEHPAVMNPCRFLERLGAKVTYLPVNMEGQVSPKDVEEAITKETILISIMHANNEIGTLQPLKEISYVAKKHGVIFHSDAAQSVGKVLTSVNELGVDLLTVAGHKLYAPKGIGALYIRNGTPIESFIHGAGHEGGRRAGTENLLLAVALGQACELVEGDLAASSDKTLEELRDYFWQELQTIENQKVQLNGHLTARLPNTLNVSFVGHIGSDILEGIPQIAASTGSACHAGEVTLSAVLKAIGVREEEGKGTIRFSLGRYTTKEDIDHAVELLKAYFASVR